jgi:hypothetical protein
MSGITWGCTQIFFGAEVQYIRRSGVMWKVIVLEIPSL